MTGAVDKSGATPAAIDDGGARQMVIEKGDMTPMAMNDGGTGYNLMALELEQSGDGTGCSWKLPSEVLPPSPLRPDGDRCTPSVEIRIARISAMFAQANTQSSSRSYTSPRFWPAMSCGINFIPKV